MSCSLAAALINSFTFRAVSRDQLWPERWPKLNERAAHLNSTRWPSSTPLTTRWTSHSTTPMCRDVRLSSRPTARTIIGWRPAVLAPTARTIMVWRPAVFAADCRNDHRLTSGCLRGRLPERSWSDFRLSSRPTARMIMMWWFSRKTHRKRVCLLRSGKFTQPNFSTIWFVG